MNSTSRDRILSRLHVAPKALPDSVGSETGMPAGRLSRKERIERLKKLMEAMRTEVHVVGDGPWIETLAQIARNKGLGTLLYSPRTEMGDALERYRNGRSHGDGSLPELVSYTGDIEDFKDRLFDVASAITTVKGAISDAGALILWPDENEPRLMSLVPPVHFAVLDADAIYNNLSEAMEKEGWQENMPANALLISGPSKTADIELTLAFGVHGPKELILLIVSGGNGRDQ